MVEEPVNETSLSEVNDSIDAGISTQTDLTMNDMAEDRAKMQDEIDHLKTELEVTREENKKLYETANALKKEGEEYLLNENFLKDKNEKVLHWIKYMGIVPEALLICRAVSKAALISLPVSTTTSNTNAITLKHFWARSWIPI